MAFTDYDKCSLLLPMDGSNNGTTFTDWCSSPKTITVNGNTKTSTAQSKYYGSSGYFDGSGDALTIASSAGLALGSGDFTICFYMYPSGYGQDWFRILHYGTNDTNGCFGIMSYGSSPTRQLWVVGYNAGAFVQYCAYSSATALILNQWQHVAVTRSGNTFRLFIDGIYKTGSDKTTSLIQNPIYIGNNSSMSMGFNGYLQDILIIKGAALWTSNFTPPTRLIGTISGTIRDKDNTLASRIVTAFPRTVPTKLYQTTSSAVDGTFSLRLPATESTALVMANEGAMRNDIVDRIIPE